MRERISNNYLATILSYLFLPLKFVGLLFPKNNTVWVFGCSSGKYYKDNSKYLFEFVSSRSSHKAVWLSKDQQIIKKLRAKNMLCHHVYSLKGIYYAVIAKMVFISYSYDDVGYFAYLFPIKTKYIQLYHGTPLKRLETEKRSKINSLLRTTLIIHMGRIFDIMFSASDISAEKLNIFFKTGREKYIVTGYARCDALFKNLSVPLLSKISRKQHFEKVIMYLPTYRSSSQDNDSVFKDFDNYVADMKTLLAKHSAILLIKLHPEDYDKAGSLASKHINTDNIFLINDKDIESDLYPYLAKTDILITDYSSVYFDYLLTNRPIIFTPFDIKTYENDDRGFYFNYNHVTPGKKASNWMEVIGAIEEEFNHTTNYSDDRLKMRNKFNKYTDGNTCLRIYNHLTNKENVD